MDSPMSWDYRVMCRKHGDDESYSIHEVFYDGDTVINWTKEPSGITCESLDDVVVALDRMREALDKPILDYS